MTYHQPFVTRSHATFQPRYSEDNVHKTKREVNITPLERIGRVLIGIAGTVWGIALLAGTPTLLTGTLEVLLVAFGLDMIVTGTTGHCPLYKKLGYTPKSLKGASHEPRAHGADDGSACH